MVELLGEMKNWTGPKSASAGSLTLPNGDLELPSVQPQSRSLQWQTHGLVDGKPVAKVPFEIVHEDEIVSSGNTSGTGQSMRHQREQHYSEYDVWLGTSGWSVALEETDGGLPVPLDDQLYADDGEER